MLISMSVFVAFVFEKGPVHSDTHDGLAGSLSFSTLGMCGWAS